MGRIKPRPLKSMTEQVFEEHSDKFTTDFNENKKVTSTLVEVQSKKLRNVLAGYATRLKKRNN